MSDHHMKKTALSITRRGLMLGGFACAAVAISARHALAQKPQPLPLDKYQRAFFNAQEWAFIMAATARLIPSEGKGPGALEARVPVFIDRQMGTPYGQGEHWYLEGPFDVQAPNYCGYQSPLSPALAYRTAIPAIDAWCETKYGASFAALDAQKQDEALTHIQKDEVSIPDIRSAEFFGLLWQNTKEGYFSDPQYGGNHDMQSWVYIGFPGARASFLEWVEKDNVPYRLGPVSLHGERA